MAQVKDSSSFLFHLAPRKATGRSSSFRNQSVKTSKTSCFLATNYWQTCSFLIPKIRGKDLIEFRFSKLQARSSIDYSQSPIFLWDLRNFTLGTRGFISHAAAFVQDLYKNLRDDKQTDVIVMDFAKAFDKVSHKKLIRKLREYGINSSINQFDHITPVLYRLHWLPIRYRINFKILLITYKAINGLAPEYISELIKFKVVSRYNLRSSSERLLEQPRIKTLVTLGDRSFEVAAPTLWNSLPVEVRNASNVQLFKRMLKTWFFRKAFCSMVL